MNNYRKSQQFWKTSTHAYVYRMFNIYICLCASLSELFNDQNFIRTILFTLWVAVYYLSKSKPRFLIKYVKTYTKQKSYVSLDLPKMESIFKYAMWKLLSHETSLELELLRWMEYILGETVLPFSFLKINTVIISGVPIFMVKLCYSPIFPAACRS